MLHKGTLDRGDTGELIQSTVDQAVRILAEVYSFPPTETRHLVNLYLAGYQAGCRNDGKP